MAKASSAVRIRQHSAKLPQQLDERVLRCMRLEGMTSFADFVRHALTRRCREIEREHGLDAEGNPVR